MRRGLILLVVALAMVGLGAAGDSLSSQPGYSAVLSSIGRALTRNGSDSWSGEGASGYVTPLGLQVSASTGSFCASVRCSDPCQSYIVSYKNAEFETTYRGYACREGLAWRPAKSETRVSPINFTRRVQPPVDNDNGGGGSRNGNGGGGGDNNSGDQTPKEPSESDKRIITALTTLRYIPETPTISVAQDGFKAFLADENATARNPQEAMNLLNAAIERSKPTSCPVEALTAKAKARACVMIRGAG